MWKLARAFWNTLTRRERAKVSALAAAVVVMAVLEVVNVSAIMPFLTVVSNPETIHENALLSWFYDRLGVESENRFLVIMGLAVFLFMLLSNGWMGLTSWMEARFVWSWNHTLSVRLLRKYLYRPYTFFLTRNTADLSKNILSEVQQIASQLMVPAIQGVGRAFVAMSLIIAMFLVAPAMALMITALVGGMYGTVYQLTRRSLSRIGADRTAANQERFTIASEALGGIKDVKLLGQEQAFMSRFERSSARFSVHQARSQIISQVPKYAIEPIAFGSVVLIVVYMILVRGDISNVIPMLGFYAFAGYRVMPAAQQAFRAVTQIRFYGPALEMLLREMTEEPETETTSDSLKRPAPASTVSSLSRLEKALELRDVTFRYPTSDTEAVRDVSLVIPARSTIGLVGATGSGKTTLVDLLLGLLRPQSGEILVDGIPITDENVREWQKQLGYVPQDIFLTDASIAENIAFGTPREKIDMDRVREAAQIAMIDEFISRELPDGYETIVGERGIRLSGGQRQRIGIARALYRNPSVLVFDEATSALDNRTEEAVMQAIRGLLGQRTTIMVAHRLTTLRDCDAIYMLERGRVAASGTYEELLQGTGGFAELTRGSVS
ncbi:MAG: ATP-binding cassette domain-containing protein [Firmicutes bacterium]|nr:ATP-binding cassette domain-containing protein [Bacillota bacterium]